MSLLARLFGKARPLPAAKTPPENPRTTAEKLQSEQQAAQVRAQQTAHDEQALQEALAGGDTAGIARLVLEGSSTRVRQQAAASIQDVELLRQLIKEVRGGDKSVYKILQGKREQLLGEQRKREQQQADIQSVAAALERHSHRAFDPLYAPTLEQLASRWQNVEADAAPELAARTREAMTRAREVITRHEEEAAASVRREQEAATAAAEARRQREEDQKAAAEKAAEQSRVKDEQQREVSAQKEAETQYLRQVTGLIRKAQGALNAGGTSRAAGVRRSLEEKLTGAPIALPAHLTSQLQALDKRLNDMKDWKSFSVAPKRTELIESMEALVDSDLEPQQLADRIKSLQEEWRTLSRGAGENAEEEWQRFHAAAQKAYEPCKGYFAAQSQARQENLRRREALAEELSAFEAAQNWDEPDWRGVISTLRQIKDEWRRASPVERAAGAAVKTRFETLTGGLQARLDAEYARNVQQKRALIDAAGRLLEEEDTRYATDEVKEIQRRWKEVGPVPRAQDQALWEELRKHCDAVFDRRQRGRDELVAGLEAKRTQAIAIIEEVEQIASLQGAELLEKAQGLDAHRDAFDGLGELPRQHARDLNRRFDRALGQVEEAVARQQAQEAEQGWSELLDAAAQVQAWRAARAEGDAGADALKAGADSHLAALAASPGRLPKGGLEALRKELAHTGTDDLAAGEAALRLLCVRAEVFTDLPSPPEDQALRRDYQVQRLMQGMGQGLSLQEGELDDLALAWVGAGPAPQSVYAALLARLKHCRAHHIGHG